MTTSTFLILPSSTMGAALYISAAMWELGRNPTSGTTQYASRVIEHPVGGFFALQLTNMLVFIRPDADTEAFLGLLSEPYQTALRPPLTAAKGSMANLAAMIDDLPEFAPIRRSPAQMQGAGWLKSEDTGL